MKKLSTKKIVGIVFLILFIIWFVCVAYNSLMSWEKSGGLSSGITDFLEENTDIKDVISEIVPVNDKLTFEAYVRKIFGHYGGYMIGGLLGFFAFFLLMDNSYYSVLVNLCVGLVCCVLSECMQEFADGRHPAMLDCLLNYEGYLSMSLCLATLTMVILAIKNKYILSTFVGRFFLYFVAGALTEVLFLIFNKGSELYYIPNVTFVSALCCSLVVVLITLIANKLLQKKKIRA